jgi:hypothetical protein
MNDDVGVCRSDRTWAWTSEAAAGLSMHSASLRLRDVRGGGRGNRTRAVAAERTADGKGTGLGGSKHKERDDCEAHGEDDRMEIL